MEMLTKVSENQIRLEFQSRLATLMKDMTQTKLAQETGLKRQTIAKYCSGRCLPTAYPLYQLANYFNVSCDYLLGREEGTRHELEKIIKKTGLTQKAIEALIEYNSLGGMKYEIAAINILLTHSMANHFFIALAKYTSAPNIDAEDFNDDVYEALFPYACGVDVTPIYMRNDEDEIDTYVVKYEEIVYYQLISEFNLLVDSIKNDEKTKKKWIEHLMRKMKPYYKQELYALYESSVNGEFSIDDIKCDKDALQKIIKQYSKQMTRDAEYRRRHEERWRKRYEAAFRAVSFEESDD